MTSTTINRTAIATTLLGLLATITGAQAQAQCVCSPRQYVVSFDLAQNCDNTNDIRGLPGIQSAFPDFCNPQLSEVTQVIIDENDSMLGSVPIRTVIDVDPPAKSGDILYTSMSDELNAGVRLEDQLDRAPSAIVVQMFGNDEDGNRVSRPFLSQISYTNECGSGPIDFQNSGLGYHSYVSMVSIYYDVAMYSCSPYV